MNFFTKLFLNAEKNISWMKIAGALVGIAGTVIALPAAGIAIPAVLIGYAHVTLAVAATVGIAGARDAIDKNKSVVNISGSSDTTIK